MPLSTHERQFEIGFLTGEVDHSSPLTIDPHQVVVGLAPSSKAPALTIHPCLV